MTRLQFLGSGLIGLFAPKFVEKKVLKSLTFEATEYTRHKPGNFRIHISERNEELAIYTLTILVNNIAIYTSEIQDFHIVSTGFGKFLNKKVRG